MPGASDPPPGVINLGAMDQNRTKILRAGGILLYLGAFLTGAGLPYPVGIPVIVAGMMTWNLLLKPPVQWGGHNPRLFVLGLLALTVVAGVLWTMGSGFAAVVGPMPPWAGPLGMALGIGMSRAVWSAKQAAELDQAIDGMIAQIENPDQRPASGPPPQDDDLTPEETRREGIVLPLIRMAPDTPDAEAEARVAQAMAELADDQFEAHDRLYRELLHDTGHPDATDAARRGHIRWLLNRGCEAGPQARILVAQAFAVADADAALLDLCCALAPPRLETLRDPWDSFPNEVSLRDQARTPGLPADTAAALSALADRIRAITPEDLRDHADGTPLSPDDRRMAKARRLLAPLTPDMTDADLLEGLSRGDTWTHGATGDLLDERAGAGDAFARRLLVLHSTRIEVLQWLSFGHAIRAFLHCAGDAGLTATFARRAAATVREDAETSWQMPTVPELRTRAADLPEAAPAVEDLIAALDAARAQVGGP